MDLLSNWLVPAAVESLSVALKDGKHDSKTSKSGIRNFQDQGDLLRVTFEPRKFVQVQNFLRSVQPFEALLSDSYTSVHATFGQDAVRQFQQSHQGQQITKDTVGGVLQILKMDFFIKKDAPPGVSLSVMIDGCKYAGCGGSAIYGEPVLLGHQDRIQALVGEWSRRNTMGSLSAARSIKNDTLGRDSREQSHPNLLFSGGEADGTSQQDLDLSTQAGFASQIPQRGLENDGEPGGSERSCLSLKEPEHSIAKQKEIKTRNHIEKLTGLLSRSVPRFMAKSWNGHVVDPTDNPVIESHSSDVSRSLTGNVEETSPLKENRSNATYEGQPDSSVTDGRTAGMTPHGVEPEGDGVSPPRLATAMEVDSPRLSREVQSADNETIRPHVSEMTTSKRTVKESVVAKSSPEDDPWQGMSRISRRDIRIPRDQRKLLESQDSWIPPEPGMRPPLANVPIAVLTSLNDKADHKARLHKAEAEKCEDILLPELVSVSGSAEGSPASSSSGSELPWSSSPPFHSRANQLPPDSSLDQPEEKMFGNHQPPSEIPGNAPTGRYCKDQEVLCSSRVKRRRIHAPVEKSRSSSPKDVSHQSSPLQSREETTRRDAVATGLSVSSSPQPSEIESQAMEIPAVDDNVNSGDETSLDVVKTQEFNVCTFEQPTKDFSLAEERPLELDNFHAHELPPLISHQSESESSELETCLPNALSVGNGDDDRDEHEIIISSQLNLPSTAEEKSNGFVQVQRSPYIGMTGFGASSSRSGSRDSLSRISRPAKERSFPAEEISSSNPVVVATLETNENPPASAGNHGSIQDMPSLHCSHDVQTKKPLVHDDCKVSAVPKHLQFKSGSESAVAKRQSSKRIDSINESTPAETSIAMESNPQYTAHEKRKPVDGLQRKSGKRQKSLNTPASFHFTQEDRKDLDPDLLAREHRRDFMKSLSRPSAEVDDSHSNGREPTQKTTLNNKRVSDPRSEASSPRRESSLEDSDLASRPLVETSPVKGRMQRHEGTFSNHGKRLSQDSRPETCTPSSSLHNGSESNSFGEERSTREMSRAHVAEDTDAEPPNIFERFKGSYPMYRGTLDQFVGTCAYIEWLFQGDRMEHRSLWDDFAARHIDDYPLWCEERQRKGHEWVPYEVYYRDHVEEPTHLKRILSPQNLMESLSLDPAAAGKMRYVTIPSKCAKSGISRPAASLQAVGSAIGQSPEIGSAEKACMKGTSPSTKATMVTVDSARVEGRDTISSALKKPSKPDVAKSISWETTASTLTKPWATPNMSDLSDAGEDTVDLALKRPSNPDLVKSVDRDSTSLSFPRPPASQDKSEPRAVREKSIESTPNKPSDSDLTGSMTRDPTSLSFSKPPATRRTMGSTKSTDDKSVAPTAGKKRIQESSSHSNTPFTQGKPDRLPNSSAAGQKGKTSPLTGCEADTHSPFTKPKGTMTDGTSTSLSPSRRPISPPPTKKPNPQVQPPPPPKVHRKPGLFDWVDNPVAKSTKRSCTGGPRPSSSSPPPPPPPPPPPSSDHSESSWWRDKNTPVKEFSRDYAQLKSVHGQMGTVDDRTGLLVPLKRELDVLKWRL
ncbi:MAG: hypothetical protein M1837_002344 [Sclerophora amabilis]|nr:MAG: hypothetical protein M1837_002344 [Sclerophora amabilis]